MNKVYPMLMLATGIAVGAMRAANPSALVVAAVASVAFGALARDLEPRAVDRLISRLFTAEGGPSFELVPLCICVGGLPAVGIPIFALLLGAQLAHVVDWATRLANRPQEPQGLDLVQAALNPEFVEVHRRAQEARRRTQEVQRPPQEVRGELRLVTGPSWWDTGLRWSLSQQA